MNTLNKTKKAFSDFYFRLSAYFPTTKRHSEIETNHKGVSYFLLYSIFCLSTLGVFMIFLSTSSRIDILVFASSGNWTQTDWSGGDGQTAWSDATMYLTSSSVVDNTPGELSMLANSGWVDPDWQFRKEITLDPDQVSGSGDLSNFPILLSIPSDSDLAADAQDDGDDILFTDDTGVDQLGHEFVSFNGTTGALLAWVNVESLSGASDTTIYMYYGNGSATTQEVPEDVWGDRYGVVHHFEETSGQHIDSTSNSNDSTSVSVEAQGTTVQAKIGRSDEFRFDTQGVVIPDNVNGSLDKTTNFSFSAWIRPRFTDIHIFQSIFIKGPEGGPARNYGLYLRDTDVYITWNNGDWRNIETTTNPIIDSSWNHIVFTRDATTDHVFVNGAEIINPGISQSMVSNNDALNIGPDNATLFDGHIDEFRITNFPMSSDWVITEFNNQNNPTDIYSAIGTEESSAPGSGTLTSSIFNTTYPSNWGNVTFSSSTPAGSTVTVKARSSNDSGMSGAPDFATCDTISSATDISGNNCVTDGHQYLQYQIGMTTDGIVVPTFNDISFAYASTDQVGPVISEITATPGETDSVVTWDTDEASSSQVQYGETILYGSLTPETDISPRVTEHTVILSDLTACTDYFYRVISEDATENSTTSAGQTFKTDGCVEDPEDPPEEDPEDDPPEEDPEDNPDDDNEEGSSSSSGGSSGGSTTGSTGGSTGTTGGTTTGSSDEDEVDEDDPSEEAPNIDDDDDEEQPVSPEVDLVKLITIQLKDEEGKGVEGAYIRINSEPKEGTTDETGTATFSNVEKGEHTLTVEWDTYRAQEKFTVGDDSPEEIRMVITLVKQPAWENPQVVRTGGIVAVVLVGLGGLMIWQSRKGQNKKK